jgi:CheY-like chemotaxis protein
MNALFELVDFSVYGSEELNAIKLPPVQILLADDDSGIQRILHHLLLDEGYAVVTAASRAEAVDLARVTKFDLAILDLNMPIKDGWETLEQIASSQPLLPVIVITARPNQLFPALASGVGALLEKPLDFTKLFSTIHSLLEEPIEIRIARSSGQSSVFSYIPPKADETEEDDQDDIGRL